MFRKTIRADESTDVDSAISDLRNQCEQASVDPVVSEMIITQVHDVLAPLVERGRRFAEMGSQLSVTRDVTGEGVSVKLVFRVNVRRSFFERLIDAIRGQ